MKSALNGGLNLSVPDGWWAEAYDGTNGWVIGDGFGSPPSEVEDDRDDDALLDGSSASCCRSSTSATRRGSR